MSTHNICFRGDIRKILCGYPLLSVATVSSQLSYQYMYYLTNCVTEHHFTDILAQFYGLSHKKHMEM